MSDKEPRRRKKRKDLPRKDDRLEEPSLTSQKSDSKDSDQEEEEVIVPTHQPSQFAKIVFLLLFSGLVVSMGFIFLRLQGAEKGPIDVFEDIHGDDHEEAHIHVEEDSHSHNAVDTAHEEFEDVLPDIGSIFSSFNFKSKKSEESSKTDQLDNAPSSVDEIDATSSYIDQSPEIELLQETENVFEPGDDILKQSADDISESIDENIMSFDEPWETELTEDEILKQMDVDVLEQGEEVKEEYLEDLEEFNTIVEASSELPPSTVEEFLDEEDDQGELTSFDSNYFEPEVEEPEIIPNTPMKDSKVKVSEFDQTLSSKTHESSLEDSVISDSPSSDLFEDPREEFVYEHADITNEDDYAHRDELDNIERVIRKSPEKALKMCEDLLILRANSPRLNYMKSQAMDQLAESQKSNKYLEDAIAAYQKVLTLKDVPEKLYMMAGTRAVDRMRFRGFLGKSLKVLDEMSQKYPKSLEIKNLMAVGYLLIGQNKESKRVFKEVLKLDPKSGFAKVHLGFILKTDDLKYDEAIVLLREGIASKEPGVVDGRFYFHLGDALHRVGKQNEAMEVYDDGVKEGLFLSAYQRSLYNVKGLTGKPWWEPLKTPYSGYFKVLEKHWITIKNEALSVMDAKSAGFMPESENLQDKGDWKQFELFARGSKIEKNCLKTPATCALIEQMPDAARCKRGQVKFSIMHPATHVWAHTGPTNCRLRSHLGLVVPDGASIRVANETRKWEEGKIILFDDSFEHEVWHNGKSIRLVLIVDFWHPELTPYQKNTLTPI